MTNMREFKNEVREATKAKGIEYFENVSDATREFLSKLDEIGARNMDKQPPETVPDIDATVELEPEELKALRAELKDLLATIK